jgi:hypothetical protein
MQHPPVEQQMQLCLPLHLHLQVYVIFCFLFTSFFLGMSTVFYLLHLVKSELCIIEEMDLGKQFSEDAKTGFHNS